MSNTSVTEHEDTASGGIVGWLKDHSKAVIAVIFWAIVLIAARVYMSANDLTFGELTNQLAEVLTGNWWGGLVYILIYLLRPLILFPATLLTLLAGNIYGLWWGFFYAITAGTLSALVPYAVGYFFGNEDEAEDQLEDDDEKQGLIKRFVGLMKENPFQAVLTMRLLYMPYDAVSLLAGGLRVNVIGFMIATLIGNIGGSFSFAGLGASIEGDITQGEISLQWETLALSVVILVVSLAVSRWLNQRQKAKTEIQTD